jgi:hypothetical protein
MVSWKCNKYVPSHLQMYRRKKKHLPNQSLDPREPQFPRKDNKGVCNSWLLSYCIVSLALLGPRVSAGQSQRLHEVA